MQRPIQVHAYASLGFMCTVCTLYNKPLCAVTACMCRYWMYAAVKAGPQGLLISNDQMRDHLFQLLAPRFFQKWKQRHQVSLPPDIFHCQTSSALGWESQQRKEAYMLSGVITRSLCTQQPGSRGWDDLLFCTVKYRYWCCQAATFYRDVISCCAACCAGGAGTAYCC